DRGEFFALDATLRRAEQLVEEGADILDVGGVKAGPGPEVSEPEELARVIPAVAAVRERFDVPISVDTWRAEVARGAYAAGAGLDLGKTWQQSLELLRRSDALAALGYPLLLSASNKPFLGKLLDLEVTERRDASLGAAALGVARGCRIVRAHDVRGTRRVCDT